ncbi:MAG: hypothetical protein ABWX84_01960 [Nocardioides sp.]
MCSIIDPSRNRDDEGPGQSLPEDAPIVATLVLLEQWRARLVSHQAWHSDWEEVTSLDQAIATIKALQDETRGLRRALESPRNERSG